MRRPSLLLGRGGRLSFELPDDESSLFEKEDAPPDEEESLPEPRRRVRFRPPLPLSAPPPLPLRSPPPLPRAGLGTGGGGGGGGGGACASVSTNSVPSRACTPTDAPIGTALAGAVGKYSCLMARPYPLPLAWEPWLPRNPCSARSRVRRGEHFSLSSSSIVSPARSAPASVVAISSSSMTAA